MIGKRTKDRPLNYRKIFSLVPLLISFLYLEVFIPFKTGNNIPMTVYHESIEQFVLRYFPMIACAYALLNGLKLRPGYLAWFALSLLYLVYLVFESLYFYNSFVQFPHVIGKVLNLLVVFAFFIFYSDPKNRPNINVLFNIILVSVFIKIATDPTMINLAAFVSHQRGIDSSSTYLLVLPCLYFFNIYIVEQKMPAFMRFIVLFFFIVFFQHRSVWVAFAAGFVINAIMLNRQKVLHLAQVIPYFFALTILVVLGASLMITYDEDVKVKLNENIENILDPGKEETTSAWRIEQMQSYWPYTQQHLVEGMRLKGFELPIQFIREGRDSGEFEDGTGHHFHSFYFDVLFYFGLVGMVLFITIIILPIVKVIKYSLSVDCLEMSLVSFIMSGFVFGLAYNLPFYYWAILGLTLAFVNKSYLKQREGKMLQAR